jgi:alpha-1,3/alpha-1,6-mannosyltransferase
VLIPQHEPASDPDVLFLLNFTSAQRTALLNDRSTKALLYTPVNEHFGIGPVEAMICGVPVLACDSGGPTESIIEESNELRTGWLRPPDPTVWADTLEEILRLPPDQKTALANRGRERARSIFSLTAMSEGIERALFQAVTLGKVNSSVPQVVALLIGFIIAFIFARHTNPSPS